MNHRRALRGVSAPVRFHPRPLAAACAVALFALAGAGPAAAQDTTTQPQAAPVSTTATAQDGKAKPGDKAGKKPKQPVTDMSGVVVTGIASSIASSMKTKEDANNIVEAISAEDIGKLPDVSIADSLSRVSGLATQRADGHANAIAIRGLSPDFAGTTLLGENLRAKRPRPRHRRRRVCNPQPHRIGIGAVHDIGGMGKAVVTGVDDHVDAAISALPPNRHVAILVPSRQREAQGREKRRQFLAFLLVGREFDEFDARDTHPVRHVRGIDRDRRLGAAHLVHQVDERASSIQCNRLRRAASELVVENLE